MTDDTILISEFKYFSKKHDTGEDTSLRVLEIKIFGDTLEMMEYYCGSMYEKIQELMTLDWQAFRAIANFFI